MGGGLREEASRPVSGKKGVSFALRRVALPREVPIALRCVWALGAPGLPRASTPGISSRHEENVHYTSEVNIVILGGVCHQGGASPRHPR